MTSQNFLLSIVIVIYGKSLEVLSNCLASIETTARENRYEILVSDNGSTDGCDRLLRERYPNVKYIVNGANLGFAAANNRALALASGTYVLFLNSDTLVQPGSLEKMLRVLAARDDIGLLGCQLRNTDGTIQPSVYSEPTWQAALLGSFGLRPLLTKRWKEKYFLTSAFDHAQDREVPSVCGAVMLASRALLAEIGGFDERFAMYSEDIDLCVEVRKRGQKVYFLSAAQIIHLGGQTALQEWSIAEQALRKLAALEVFMRKHQGARGWALYRVMVLAGAILRWPLYAVLGLFSPSFRDRRRFQRKIFGLLAS